MSQNISNPRRKLSPTEKLIDKLSDVVTTIPKNIPPEERIARLSEDQKAELEEIEFRAISHFVGVLDELEAALGMLRIGHHVGWKVLYLVHSKKTIRKYEEILGIKIREIFPETGPSSYRSVGFGISEKFSNFWKFVSGDIKLTKEDKENRRKFE